LSKHRNPYITTLLDWEKQGVDGVGVSYTTMDDNSWLEPEIEFYTSKAKPWVTLCSNTEKLTEMT